jgi:hypothetical protein
MWSQNCDYCGLKRLVLWVATSKLIFSGQRGEMSNRTETYAKAEIQAV